MRTSEFFHYDGCGHKDLDNCAACALLNAGSEGPNYSGWPLAFLQNSRRIPSKYIGALRLELTRTDNDAYLENLKTQLTENGYDVLTLLKQGAK